LHLSKLQYLIRAISGQQCIWALSPKPFIGIEQTVTQNKANDKLYVLSLGSNLG
jgi:hypothetical protein